MNYENVLGERKFPTYEQLKTGLLRLIDEGKISREDASRLLPELRESEDERIRMALIELLKEVEEDETYTGRQHISEMLEYLEKQKEQKHVEKQDYSGLNDLERAIHRGFLSAGVENVLVTIIKETARECLAQMKPAEWSEEDEKMRARIIMFLAGFMGNEDMIDWLKSLRPSWKPSDEQIFYLSKAIKTLGEEGDCKTVAILNEIRLEIKKL